jgi:hypothetical protein
MKTVFFHGKDKNITSMRTGNPSLKLTQYMDNSAGGVTFRTKGFTSRFNNKGMLIGTSIKTGKYTTYFGKNGSVTTRLTPFK